MDEIECVLERELAQLAGGIFGKPEARRSMARRNRAPGDA
jgi:hypothetical protein